ncbi:alpha-mannosidase [Paenibacillus beijingensis]|uniref:Alpha-mannosidase n=1 Tax=Paenibacillus beijingensis TaxID=1126833 RepID=A0A0D5NFU4_9BACL|nr:alpha-mannosidase [Paenibacillus beijingensis]AJY74244.1 alpha-mannosidase [Paenibacillus beijingensis]
MNNRFVCHLISHTHWDREWYLPYEKHHVRLIRLMDELLDLLEKDAGFNSFHLDGQTIILEDYLQVRPEMRGKLVQYIKEGRLHIGPWYILQDEFLTSSEANIRNLMTGFQDARQYGNVVSKLGYFPDSFGNMGQAAQILRQAGIDTAVFGRGVKPTGFNNAVEDQTNHFESPFSEMIWQSPDGSSVLGILFANWYHNGMEVPAEEEEALGYWEKRIEDAKRYASTPHLLFMNGCDHQPVQTDLTAALTTARKVLPDVQFVHSSFERYIEQVKPSLPSHLSVVKGELRSQHTDGWFSLVNTASARVYMKQKNQIGQAMLEKVAEPLAAFAHLLGQRYPHHLFTYAWKTLMQNHPHDSICGCSIDEVHREMMTRFDKSLHVAEVIVEESLKAITRHIQSDVFTEFSAEAVPFSVFNTSGWVRTGVVSVVLEIKRLPIDGKVPALVVEELQKESDEDWILVDRHGNKISSVMEDLGVQFGYDLPEERFRQPYMARKHKLTFAAEDVPALGFKTYAWIKNPVRSDAAHSEAVPNSSLVSGEREMENEWLKVAISEDGRLVITEKQSGHTFSELLAYEDVGDIGNEYVFKQPDGESAITTKGLKAAISLIEDHPYRASFEIIHELAIPKGANEVLQTEISQMVLFKERKAQRVEETVPLKIVTRVSLEKGGKGVKVKTAFDNKATDHRLRVLFPVDLKTDVCSVDSIFEVAQRNIQPAPEWENPSNCQHQQAFVDVSDERAGLTIANLGLNEYEILRDGRNTIALTLLRSVGELGDWGVFPTPEAQCLGEQTAEFEIIPHPIDGVRSGAFVEAYQFQIPWTVQQTGVHSGKLPADFGLLEWSGEGIAFSSMKINDQTDDLIIRWFNMIVEESEIAIKVNASIKEVYTSNVLEEIIQPIAHTDTVSIDVGPAQITTLGMKFM